jgi:hypothetical protein
MKDELLEDIHRRATEIIGVAGLLKQETEVLRKLQNPVTPMETGSNEDEITKHNNDMLTNRQKLAEVCQLWLDLNKRMAGDHTPEDMLPRDANQEKS